MAYQDGIVIFVLCHSVYRSVARVTDADALNQRALDMATRGVSKQLASGMAFPHIQCWPTGHDASTCLGFILVQSKEPTPIDRDTKRPASVGAGP